MSGATNFLKRNLIMPRKRGPDICNKLLLLAAICWLPRLSPFNAERRSRAGCFKTCLDTRSATCWSWCGRPQCFPTSYQLQLFCKQRTKRVQTPQRSCTPRFSRFTEETIHVDHLRNFTTSQNQPTSWPLWIVFAEQPGLCEGGTSYPGAMGTGAREDETAHAKFFCNQAQSY